MDIMLWDGKFNPKLEKLTLNCSGENSSASQVVGPADPGVLNRNKKITSNIFETVLIYFIP